jgi:hypothetical protein
LGTKITFERVIVMPDGQRYVEGVTPKQLPAPDANWSQNNAECASQDSAETAVKPQSEETD